MDDEYKERIQPANYDEDTSDELESRYCKKFSFDWFRLVLASFDKKSLCVCHYFVFLSQEFCYLPSELKPTHK